MKDAGSTLTYIHTLPLCGFTQNALNYTTTAMQIDKSGGVTGQTRSCGHDKVSVAEL